MARTVCTMPPQAQASVQHRPLDRRVKRRHVVPPGRSESIQVPGRPAGWTWFPGRFEQRTVGEPDQDRIERTRFQVDFRRQVIAIAPPHADRRPVPGEL